MVRRTNLDVEQLMILKHKFLSIAILLVLVSIACSGFGAAPEATPTPLPVSTAVPAPTGETPPPEGDLETVTVARVVDGDTIELTNGRRVRYLGMNTPERGQPFYEEATEVNRRLVEGKSVQLERDVESFDQYGRILAYVWVDGVMANREIVSQGYANVYTVPPNVRYETELRAAEQAAREGERGLWAGSSVPLKIIQLQADAPGSDRENPNGEWVEIANQGNAPVDMTGYTLKDEANHIYTFADYEIGAGQRFKLFTGPGNDTDVELYWGFRGESVWNNDSDVAFLRDPQGGLVDTYAY